MSKFIDLVLALLIKGTIKMTTATCDAHRTEYELARRRKLLHRQQKAWRERRELSQAGALLGFAFWGIMFLLGSEVGVESDYRLFPGGARLIPLLVAILVVVYFVMMTTGDLLERIVTGYLVMVAGGALALWIGSSFALGSIWWFLIGWAGGIAFGVLFTMVADRYDPYPTELN